MGAATDRTMPMVVALIGHPVAHSRSPSMQQAALDAFGLRARYELWDTDPGDLERRIAQLRSPGMLGANVTIPYKLAVAPLLDELAPSVTAVAGAVNTIVRAEAPHQIRLIGHNTDADVARGRSAACGAPGRPAGRWWRRALSRWSRHG